MAKTTWVCVEDFTLTSGRGKFTNHAKGSPAPVCEETTKRKLIRAGLIKEEHAEVPETSALPPSEAADGKPFKKKEGK